MLAAGGNSTGGRAGCTLVQHLAAASRCEANDLEPLRMWVGTSAYRGHDPFPTLRRNPFDTQVRQTVAKLCVALRSPALRARCGGGSGTAARSEKEPCADLSDQCASTLRWGSCGERFFAEYCCQACGSWAEARKPRMMVNHTIP